MNKQYMLVEVVERDINGTMFNSFEEARQAMAEAYEEIKSGTDECEISTWWAWVNDGPNHDNYDWKIIEC